MQIRSVTSQHATKLVLLRLLPWFFMYDSARYSTASPSFSALEAACLWLLQERARQTSVQSLTPCGGAPRSQSMEMAGQQHKMKERKKSMLNIEDISVCAPANPVWMSTQVKSV